MDSASGQVATPSGERRIGLDLGGTKSLAVLTVGGEVVDEARLPTVPGPGSVDAAVALVERLGGAGRVGVGAAGLVDRSGVWRVSPNVPGVRSLPLLALVRQRLGAGVEVRVDNDATCATLAEWTRGAAAGERDVAFVAFGTGIGAGLVSGGVLQRGAHGFASEAGHMVVDPAGPPCVCGRVGCWERYASGAGLARFAREAADGGRLARVVELAGGDPAAVRGEAVVAAAREGDPGALAVLERFAWWGALGLANLTNVVDPGVIVLGGGLIEAREVWWEPMLRAFAELLYSAEERPRPRIVPAALGERAGAVGATLLFDALPVPGPAP